MAAGNLRAAGLAAKEEILTHEGNTRLSSRNRTEGSTRLLGADAKFRFLFDVEDCGTAPTLTTSRSAKIWANCIVVTVMDSSDMETFRTAQCCY